MTLLFSSIANATLVEHLKPTEVESRLRSRIADLDVSFGANLFDLDLFEGIGLSARYRYEVEDSYLADFHTRIDRWRIRAKLNVGDILEADTPLYFNIDRNQEVYFVRQFKSKKKALLAMPYHLKQLPLTAKKALKGLKPGDLVSIPANMSVAFGAQASTSYLSGMYGISASANVYYILSGRFQVQVYRMKDNKVRLKLIAQTSKTAGTSARVKGDLSIFGVSIADKLVEKIFNVDFLKFSSNRKKGEQFIIDYIFDLNAPKAAQAYDQIMSSTYKFKDLSLFQEFIHSNGLGNRMVSTYELAEKVFQEDRLSEKKRVNRLFKGFNKFKQRARNLRLSLLIASFKRDKTFTKNRISFEKQDGEKQFFYYPVYNHYVRTKLGTGSIGTKGKIEKSMFGLVPTDRDGKDSGAEIKDFGFTYERKDKIFRRAEQANFIEFLKNHLHKDIFSEIDLKDFERYNGKRNSHVYFRLILKKTAFDVLSGMREKQIRRELKAFYKGRKELYADPLHGLLENVWNVINPKWLTEKSQLKKASKILFEVSNGSLSGKDRLEKLMELRNNFVFQKVGFAFIAEKLTTVELEKHMALTLTMQADDVERVDFKFGKIELSRLYFVLRHAHNAIMNRSFDLRLSQEEQDHLENK